MVHAVGSLQPDVMTTPERILSASLVLAVTATASTASADQCAYITKDQAATAARIVRDLNKYVVAYFCKPCGDKETKKDAVKTIEVKRVDSQYLDGEYYELQINGEGVDLAYTYVPLRGDSFRNLAMAARCPAQDVPEFITVK
jgi:hypothetical protein